MADPLKHSAHELNQVLRGHNYFYNDFLMTTKFHIEEGIASAVGYFEMNVKILAEYLKSIANDVKKYLEIIGDDK